MKVSQWSIVRNNNRTLGNIDGVSVDKAVRVLVDKWVLVGGISVGDLVGFLIGEEVGKEVGDFVGVKVGDPLEQFQL
eukprot:8033432-Ditylum_brightwellii.AAC.1